MLLLWCTVELKWIACFDNRGFEKFHMALSAKIPAGTKPEDLPSEVKQSMLGAVGLNKVRVSVVGAAPIRVDILQFFQSLGLTIFEIYGQSEDCGPTTFNQVGKFGSVGPAFPGVEVTIAEDDEILVKGPNVFLGYYKDEAATKATLKDGWLYSGDTGRIDEEGLIYITGRKKDIIITSGGKNITPSNIELAIKAHPLASNASHTSLLTWHKKQTADLNAIQVSEAVVIGDKRPYLVALITLEPDVAALKAKDMGIEVAELVTNEAIRTALDAHIETVNADLAQVETIKRFAILPNPFSLEKGEVTPTMKVKRNVVQTHYTPEIDAIYAQPFERQ